MDIFSLVGQIFLGWLLVDFLTGVFHWWEDELGNEDWPIIGPWIVAPNRLHHTKPLEFTKTSFMDRNRASIIAALLVGFGWWWFIGLSVFAVTFLVGAAISNEIHYYAHCPSKANKTIAVLQKIGVFQSAKGHAVHHKPPSDVQFCVMTDWLNPVLEATGFWRHLRRLVPVAQR